MKYVYKSVFKKEMEDYMLMRLNSGFDEGSFSYLKIFDAFLCEKGYSDHFITKDIIDQWAIQKNTEIKNTRNSRVNVIKQFCQYLNDIGINAYVPDYHFSSSKNVPYILSKEELVLFYNGIDLIFKNYRYNKYSHYTCMVPVLFRLLYACGLRNNEACSIRISDIDWNDKTILILSAKNKKDRLVYMSDDVCNMLHDYLKYLSRHISSQWLFPSYDFEKHINKSTVCSYCHKAVLLKSIGNSTYYPTPHSLRHTFVVHLIDRWVSNNENVDVLIPYLAKQLGHKTAEETYYYYHMLVTSYENIQKKDRNLIPEVSEYEEEQ